MSLRTYLRIFPSLACAVLSATAALPGQVLVADSTVPAPQVNPALIMPIHCDSSSDIFLRPPLSKIDSEGRRTATFDLSAAQSDGFSDLTLNSFAVDPDGTLYALALTRDQHAVIVRFRNDGAYSGSTPLDGKFYPLQFASFNGNAFLVFGVAPSGSPPNLRLLPYSGLFDCAGRFVKTLDPPKPSANSGAKPGSERPGYLPSGASLAIAESDGTDAYFLEQGASPTVTVISAAGVIDRTLTLSPPFPNAQVSGLRVGLGQILVEYTRPQTGPNENAVSYYYVYNSATGDKLIAYTQSPGLHGTLGCTDWRGSFTFLSTDKDGRSILVRARAR